jgi:hypothetical protein
MAGYREILVARSRRKGLWKEIIDLGNLIFKAAGSFKPLPAALGLIFSGQS